MVWYRKRTKEEWLEEAHKAHGYKYDYSKVDFNKKSAEKVEIICPIHGSFFQVVRRHLQGSGCPECYKESCGQYQKLSQEEFIRRAESVHGNKYDYSESIYNGVNKKIKVICHKHGPWMITPTNLWKGEGCPKCANEKTSKRQLFTPEKNLEILNKIHNDKYDYSLSEFPITGENPNKKIKIICPIHGVFEQNLHMHRSGQGCPKCGKERTSEALKSNKESFIERAKKIHGDKYDYSEVIYINNFTKVKIKCNKCGNYFYQKPNAHIDMKHGCNLCYTGRKSNTEEFIKKAITIHGNLYDYSEVDYKNNTTPVKIICKKHGEFLQRPGGHLIGSGCPKCYSSKGEASIRSLLEDNNIKFFEQKIFKNLRRLRFDFYLPDYNLCIEYQGMQHYKPIEAFGGLESFIKGQERDNMKREFCKKNNINLLEIKYDQNIRDVLLGYLNI